jgi:hypothetical protein
MLKNEASMLQVLCNENARVADFMSLATRRNRKATTRRNDKLSHQLFI